ncbi:MAG TPA: hypothetical protein VGA69_01040 [Nitriliruptorales bacterium]
MSQTGPPMPRVGDLALTVRQPYADLEIAGIKPIENRTWPPPATLPQWGRCDACGARGLALDLPCPVAQGTTGRRSHHIVWDGPFPFRLWIHAGRKRDTTHPMADWASLTKVEVGGQTRLAGDSPDRYGVLLGSVQVTGCHHADECAQGTTFTPNGRPVLRHEPRWCSPWAELGVYHWTLADPQPLDTPIAMRGRQRLWRISADDLQVALAERTG